MTLEELQEAVEVAEKRGAAHFLMAAPFAPAAKRLELAPGLEGNVSGTGVTQTGRPVTLVLVRVQDARRFLRISTQH